MPRLTSDFLSEVFSNILPNLFMVCKFTEYKRSTQHNRDNEQNKRKITERELVHLNHKIDKLLVKLEENEPELATSPDEECVICISAKATMQTYPCAHRVVCRRCFVKTIQVAVSQRLLPLRCVVCRAKILRLRQSDHRINSASNCSSSITNGRTSNGYRQNGNRRTSTSLFKRRAALWISRELQAQQQLAQERLEAHESGIKRNHGNEYLKNGESKSINLSAIKHDDEEHLENIDDGIENDSITGECSLRSNNNNNNNWKEGSTLRMGQRVCKRQRRPKMSLLPIDERDELLSQLSLNLTLSERSQVRHSSLPEVVITSPSNSDMDSEPRTPEIDEEQMLSANETSSGCSSSSNESLNQSPNKPIRIHKYLSLHKAFGYLFK